MQTHIIKARRILDKNLPFNYVKPTLDNLANKKIIVTGSVIRNVKRGLSSRIDVLNALVEVAIQNKKLIASLEKLTA